jgi:hypothetical protein
MPYTECIHCIYEMCVPYICFALLSWPPFHYLRIPGQTHLENAWLWLFWSILPVLDTTWVSGFNALFKQRACMLQYSLNWSVCTKAFGVSSKHVACMPQHTLKYCMHKAFSVCSALGYTIACSHVSVCVSVCVNVMVLCVLCVQMRTTCMPLNKCVCLCSTCAP